MHSQLLGTNHPTYRAVRPLPSHLLHHTTICIEEGLHTQAFDLLTCALTAGTCTPIPAAIPPPSILAFAATLIVHPRLTTRTRSEDHHAAADAALRYLRLVNQLVGPEGAGWRDALRFAEDDGRRGKRARGRRRGSGDAGAEVEDDKEEEMTDLALRSPYVGSESLWTTAGDFWAVVGWALNCSVAYPARWQRWKVWLELMLDVLEDDLQLCMSSSDTASSAESDSGSTTETSLLARYLLPVSDGRQNKRRLMRAILADGSTKSLAEFGEIWKHETRALQISPPNEPRAKRRKLDLENDDFGDYYDHASEDDTDESPASGTKRSSRAGTTAPHPAAASESDDLDTTTTTTTTTLTKTPSTEVLLPDTASLHLRHRLLALLATFSSLSSPGFLDLEDLFDLYTEFLRPLPLPLFQSYILPTTPYLSASNHVNLLQMLARPLLTSSAPTRKLGLPFTQPVWQKFYAPWTASQTSVVENAKVSLIVEALLRILWREGQLCVNAEVREVVERGVRARRERAEMQKSGPAKVRGRMEKREVAVPAWEVLDASARRMGVVLELV